MPPPLRNNLWKKAKGSDVYLDIFNIAGHKMDFNDLTKRTNQFFESTKYPDIDHYNIIASVVYEEGKALGRQNKFVDAMKCFNQCLRLAETGSSNVGISYVMRSECFFQMDMPEECLIDIDLARKSNCPDRPLSRLDVRAAKCATMLEDEEFQAKRFEKIDGVLSFEEHETFAGVANVLELRQNDDSSQYVVATRDLIPGQTVLVEHPYAIIRDRSGRTRDRCDYCFLDFMNFIACDKCIDAIFCNESCLQKSHHKYECVLPRSLPFCRTEIFELALRVFLNVNNAFSDADVLMTTVERINNGLEVNGLTNDQKNFCSIFQLAHKNRKRSHSQFTSLRAGTGVAIITIMRFPEFKRKFNTLQNKRFLQHFILHLFYVAEQAIDLAEFHSEELDGDSSEKTNPYRFMGKGLYPFACYINPSDEPNVDWHTIDGHLICDVHRPIKKGEQLSRTICPSLFYCRKRPHCPWLC